MKIPKRFITLVLGVPLAALGVVACYGHMRSDAFEIEVDFGNAVVRTEMPAIEFTEEDFEEMQMVGPILVTVGKAYGTGTRLFPTVRRCITSGFGERTDPIEGDEAWHAGIDVCAAGKNSRASADGVVTFAGAHGGYGNMVEITHEDGYKTLYAHHAQLFVELGDEVKTGEELGVIGSTGRSTGPHLHFEVHKKTKKGTWIAINPKTYIR